jgi:pimeloyl-ACP methyl ester carboxylesterase
MVPGVGGGPWSQVWAYRGFRAAGVEAEIHINHWKTPWFDILGHLQDLELNRKIAAEAAEKIEAYRHTHPHAPIDLVGYSAGGGVALLCAEALPEDIHLRNLLLVQPGVSPTWNLDRALRRVDGVLVNFYCPSDWFILGLGTEVYGTVDRKKVASAGKQGFDLEQAVPDASLRDKVVQEKWNWGMITTGHIGNHTSILLESWNRKYVAPYLLPEGKAITSPAAARAALDSGGKRTAHSPPGHPAGDGSGD